MENHNKLLSERELHILNTFEKYNRNYLGHTNSGYNNYSQYDNNYRKSFSPLLSLDEYRAQEQTRWDRVGNSIPRFLSGLSTNIAQIPGYLYAVGEATFTDKTLSESLNNSWIDYFQGLDERSKAKFEIYTPEAVKQGNLWDNISSTSFWTKEFTDGLSFLAAALAPGAALKGAGMSAKLSRLFDISTSAANKIELGTATAINTLFEAGVEAKQVRDDLEDVFRRKIARGEVNPKTGLPYTKEDAEEIINIATRNTAISNLLLLVGPNLLMNKALLGRFSSNKSMWGKYINPTTGEFIKVPELTIKQKAGEYLKSMGKLAFSEGFVEEGGQSAIIELNKKLAEDSDYIKGGNFFEYVTDYVTKFAQTYVEQLSETEMQKSIFLGGVLGTLGGGIQEGRKNIYEKENVRKLMNQLAINFQGFSKSNEGILETDSQGNVKVNPYKFVDFIKNVTKEDFTRGVQNFAAAHDNQELYDYLEEKAFTRLIYPYLSLEDGDKLAKKQIKFFSEQYLKNRNLIENNGKEVELTKEQELENKKREQEYIAKKEKLIDDLFKFGKSINRLITNSNLEKFDTKLNRAEAEFINDFVNKIKVSALQSVTEQLFFKEKINEYKRSILELQSKDLEGEIPEIQNQIKETQKKLDYYSDLLTTSSEQYKHAYTPEAVKELYKIEKEKFNELQNKKTKDTKTDKPSDDKKPNESDKTKQNDVKSEESVDEEVEYFDKDGNKFTGKLYKDKNGKFYTVNKDGEKIDLVKHELFDIWNVDYGEPNDSSSPPSENDDTKPYFEIEDKKFKGIGEFINIFNYSINPQTGKGYNATWKIQQIISSNPDLLDKVTIRVTKSKREKKITELTGNKNIVQLSSDFDVALMLDDKIIGFLPSATKFLRVGKDGKYEHINYNTLTESEFRQLFGADEKHSLEAFKEEFKNAYSFLKYIENIYSKQGDFVISNSELKAIASLSVTLGEYDLVNNSDNLVDLSTYDRKNLIFSNDLPIFVEVGNIYNEGIKESRKRFSLFSKDNFTDDSGDLPKDLLESLESLQSIVDRNSDAELYSRYFVAVKNPGGKYSFNGERFNWVALTPKKLLDTDSLLKFLKEKKEQLKNAVKHQNIYDLVREVNLELSKRVYLSNLVVKKGERASFLDFKFLGPKQTEDGLINQDEYNAPLLFSYKLSGVKEKKSTIIYSFDTIEDIINKINEDFGGNTKGLSLNNFRENIPLQKDYKKDELYELINKFSTLVKPNVKYSQTIRVSFDKLRNSFRNINPALLASTPETGVERTIITKGGAKVTFIDTSKQEDKKDPVDLKSEYESLLNKKESGEKLTKEEFLRMQELKDIIGNNLDEAFKISDTPAEDLIDMQVAFRNLSKILPGFISVQVINVIKDNLQKNSITWGYFKDKIIYLSEKAESGTEFHEAFHAVFRTVLSDREIKALYKDARKKILEEFSKEGKIFTKELNKFRNKHPKYSSLSENKLKELFYEEWMADKYKSHKKGKNQVKGYNLIERFFNLLVDLFHFLTSQRYKTIEFVFDRLDRGGYKNSKLKKNRFYGVREPVYSLIPNNILSSNIYDPNTKETKKQFFKTYDSQYESKRKINLVYSKLYERLNSINLKNIIDNIYSSISEGNLKDLKNLIDNEIDKVIEVPVVDDIINEILDELKWEWDIKNPIYDNIDLNAVSEGEKSNYDYISQNYFTFSNPEARKVIIEEVKRKYKNLHKSLLEEEEFKEELGSIEDSDEETQSKTVGGLGIDTNKEDKGGLESQSFRFRSYISITTYQEKDRFGIERTYGVDEHMVYNQLLKIAKNSYDFDEIIQKLRGYFTDEHSSTQVKNFINKFFSDTLEVVNYNGDYFTENGEYKVKNLSLFNLVLKSINKFHLDYLFIGLDYSKKIFDVYSANRENVGVQQVESWKINYSVIHDSLFEDGKITKKGERVINELSDSIDNISGTSKINSIKWINYAKKLKESLENIRVDINLSYAKYIVISGEKRERTKEQQDFYLSYKQGLHSNDYIIRSLNIILDIIQSGNSPFEVVEDSSDANKQGALTRLYSIAEDNYKFSPELQQAIIENAKGKNVNSMQDPSYDLLRTLQISREDVDKLEQEDPYLRDNFLLSSEDFINSKHSLVIQRTIGARNINSIFVAKDEEKGLESDTRIEKYREQEHEGTDFSDWTGRDMAVFLYALYSNQKLVVNSKDKSKFVRTASFYYRVLGTSANANVVDLPVFTAVDKESGNITDFTLNAFYKEVKRQAERIQRLKLKDPNEFRTTIKDYNDSPNARGYKFWHGYDKFIPDDIKVLIYQSSGKDIIDILEKNKKEILAHINNFLEIEFERHLEHLDRLGVIKKTSEANPEKNTKADYENRLLDNRFFGISVKGKDLIFEPYSNYRVNIKQAWLNMYLNTQAYNQLLNGDEAKSFSNPGRITKRGTLGNAQGFNLSSSGIENYTYAVLPENTSSENSLNVKVNVADAQVFGSFDFFERYLISLGRNEGPIPKILEKIKRGEDITWEEKNILENYNAIFSPKKISVNDGEVTMKCSVAYNDINTVSFINSKGEREPFVGCEERFEQLKKKIDLIADSTALKTQIINQSESFTDLKINEIDSRFVREQMLVPSGKKRVTHSTQSMVLIPFETGREDLESGYDDVLAQRVNSHMKILDRVLFKITEEGVQPTLGLFQKMALKIVEESGGNSQIMELLSLDSNGEPKFNNNIPSVVKKFSEIFLSHYKKILSAKVKGKKNSIQTNYGIPLQINTETGKIIRRDWIKSNSEEYERLKKDGKVTSRKLGYNLKGVFNGKEVRYSEVMIPKYFRELYDIKPGDEIPDHMAYMFGLRIPNTDKHSNHVLKAVDFLPLHMGDTMILPEELIEIVGHDFDMDAFYTHSYEFYEENGKYYLYGNTKHSKWYQFYIYNTVNNFENNKFLGMMFEELISSDQDYLQMREIIKKLNKLPKDYPKDNYLFEISNGKYDSLKNFYSRYEFLKKSYIELAMDRMGLPSNPSEYNEDINIGAINNDILSKSIEILSLPQVEEIQNTPEKADLVKSSLEELASILELNSIDDLATNYSVYSPSWIISEFEDAQEGSKAIGASVNKMLSFVFLNKYEIPIEDFNIVFDNVKYSGFKSLREILPNGEMGERIMNILASFVVTSTDNQNLSYSKKANLTIKNIGLVATMIQQGVPLKTAMKIVTSPIIKKFTLWTQGAAVKTDSEIKLGEKNAFEGLFAEIESFLKKYEVSKEELEEGITTDELIFYLKNGYNNKVNDLSDAQKREYYKTEFKVLSLWKKLSEIDKYFMALNNIIKLTKGVDNTFESVDEVIDSLKILGYELAPKGKFGEVEIVKSKVKSNSPFILDNLFKRNKLVKSNIEIVGKMLNNSQHIFIQRDKIFIDIYNEVYGQLRKHLRNRKQVKNQLSSYLLEYLISKAYRQYLKNIGEIVEPNAMLHRSLNTDTTKDLVTYIKEYISKYPELKNNLFIKLLKFPKVDRDAQKVTLKVRKISSPEYASQALDDFKVIYNSPKTKPLADLIFRYLIYSDAGSFRSHSMIKLLPGVMFSELSKSTSDIQKLLSQGYQKSLTSDYERLFECKQDELIDEFKNLYLRNLNNRSKLPIVKKYVLLSNKDVVTELQDGFKIDLFGGYISEKAIKAKFFNNDVVYESKEKFFEAFYEFTNSEKEKAYKVYSENIKYILNSPVFELKSDLEENEQKTKNKIKFKEYFIVLSEKGLELYKLESIVVKKYDPDKKTFYEILLQPKIEKGESTAVGTSAIYKKVSFLYDTFPLHGRDLQDVIQATQVQENQEIIKSKTVRERKNPPVQEMFQSKDLEQDGDLEDGTDADGTMFYDPEVQSMLDLLDSKNINFTKQDVDSELNEFINFSKSINYNPNQPSLFSDEDLRLNTDLSQENIYSQLGNKTQSENVVIRPWGELKDATKAIIDKGIVSTRIPNTNEHFGNPFSHDPTGKTQGLIKTETIKEAVEKYIDWILNGYKKEIKGINIFSKSTEILGKRLTNPNWYAKDLMDVEAPYKANASKVKAPQLNAEEALKYDMNLMYSLQVQKFRKNPELIDEINQAGGLDFIKQSSHIVGVKNSRWEGKGLESNFIKVLAKAYETVAKELNKFQETTEIESKRREWIIEHLKSGKLKGKPILYYKELGEPSHATALDYLINKYDWNKNTSQVVDSGITEQDLGLSKNRERIKKQYPLNIKFETVVGTIPTNKLQEAANFNFDERDFVQLKKGEDYLDTVYNLYGEAASRYVSDTNSEISKQEGEWLKSLGNKLANDFITDYLESELGEGKTIKEYAQSLLDKNVQLIDTNQLSLFSDEDLGLNTNLSQEEAQCKDGTNNKKAEDGIRSPKFTKGSQWEIYEIFEGKSHKQGGIEINIKNNQINFTNKNGSIKAKYGLVISKDS